MQFLIDTATDSPAELYKIGKFLVDQFSVVPVAPPEARPVLSAADDMPSDAVDTQPAAAPSFTPSPANLTTVGVPPAITPFAGPIAPAPAEDPDIDTDEAPPTPVSSFAATVVVPAGPVAASSPLVAPPPPTPAPPGLAAPAELDSRGMPWDSRIHAANRSKTIKGEWKAKRGVDPNLVTAVEAQNRPAGPTQAAPAAEPPIYGTTVAPGSELVQTTVALVPPPPPAPVAPSAVGTSAPPVMASAAPPAPAAAPAIDFRGLMIKIQTASAAGKLTPEQVNGALATVGLKPEDMGKLINDAPLIASVNAGIDACLA